ncbi:hypothetical protein BC629DRAFT_416851 [Irpex lacteus]|nr:hypothetical protein BC629DRAFT_416851 [Irpex lacteus]
MCTVGEIQLSCTLGHRPKWSLRTSGHSCPMPEVSHSPNICRSDTDNRRESSPRDRCGPHTIESVGGSMCCQCFICDAQCAQCCATHSCLANTFDTPCALDVRV